MTRRLLLLALLLGSLPAISRAAQYGVQVAAFREFERAEEVQVALEDAGYNSYFSEIDGYKRVRVGPFSSKSKAEDEARALRSFLVARFGPLEFERHPWVMEEDREISNAPLAAPPIFPVLEPVPIPALIEPIDPTAESIITRAQSYLGVPYRWGGRGPDGFDCSGFTSFVFSTAGFAIPRTARMQFRVGEAIEADALEPGDLVFFSTYSRGPSHVGIFIGGGEFIHASSGSGHVVQTPLSKRYYTNRYLGARRVLELQPEELRRLTVQLDR